MPLVRIVRRTYAAFAEDKAPRLAAVIAFSAIFSIAPLFVLTIAILGGLLGIEDGTNGRRVVEGHLLGLIRRSAGPEEARFVHELVTALFDRPRANVLARISAWIFFVAGSSGLFLALQDALNTVWRIEGTRGGWRAVVRVRLLSFAMVVLVFALTLATLVANAVLAYVARHLPQDIRSFAPPSAIGAASDLITVVALTVAFALVFKVLPDVQVRWRDVWVGAVVTAVLFALGEVLLSVYFATAGVASAYGAAGVVLAALLWSYYSALIFMFGAEFTKVYSGTAGLKLPSLVRDTVERPAGDDPRETPSTADIA
ncbi:MAG: YihY/virulence factor BrkB family protein [Vulcanimicrobiaceae bacterium]